MTEQLDGLRIAVIGTGKVGGTLGARWARKGHRVVFGSRDPQGDKVRQLLEQAGENATATTAGEAAQNNDVLILATPWNSAQQVLSLCGDLTGKVLIDCSNPIRSDFKGLDLGFTESAAERIAAWSPGARVVKAFNTASAKTMQNPVFGDQRATMFYCGDDSAAKAIVHRLADELDFEPVDAGPLEMARHLEPLAWLYIYLAVNQGLGANCAFKILQR